MARVFASLAPGADAREIASRAQDSVPDALAMSSLEMENEGTRMMLAFTVHVPSMPAIEDFEQALETAVGVTEVEIVYPRETHVHLHWFEAMVAASAAVAARRRRNAASSSRSRSPA